MEFTTKVQIPRTEKGITYHNKILMLGSCFADEIGQYLKDYRFNVMINPFGTLYNPSSIAGSAERLSSGKAFVKEDIIECNKIYSSFFHHSSVSGFSEEEFLTKANASLNKSSAFFKEADTIIITLGTAFVYRHISRNIIVSNCHKIRAGEFERRLLTVKECVKELQRIVNAVEKAKSDNRPRRIIFTVSPIRHLKDGAHYSQLSKAALLLAVDEILKNTGKPGGNSGKTGNISMHYFPSYEIMLDELRDYRFYAGDMIHPSQQAVEYIFERFAASFIAEESYPLMKEAIRITKALNHRPLFPESKEYMDFRKKLEADMEIFNKKTGHNAEK